MQTGEPLSGTEGKTVTGKTVGAKGACPRRRAPMRSAVGTRVARM